MTPHSDRMDHTLNTQPGNAGRNDIVVTGSDRADDVPTAADTSVPGFEETAAAMVWRSDQSVVRVSRQLEKWRAAYASQQQQRGRQEQATRKRIRRRRQKIVSATSTPDRHYIVSPAACRYKIDRVWSHRRRVWSAWAKLCTCRATESEVERRESAW